MSKQVKIISASVAPPTAVANQHHEKPTREPLKRHCSNSRPNQTLERSRDCGVTSYEKMSGNRRTTADMPPAKRKFPYYSPISDMRPDEESERFASKNGRTKKVKVGHFPSEDQEEVNMASLRRDRE